MNYIYKKFLDDKKVYEKNEVFWKSLIKKLLQPENIVFDEYIATDDGYGNKFYDGNPITNFKVDKLNKCVRIIQEEPEESSIQLSARIEDTELSNGDKFQELTIHLELTTETVFIAIDLINAWILNDLTTFRMKRYIETVKSIKSHISENENVELVD